MDFTCSSYDRLLASAHDAGYRVLRIRDALSGPVISPALIIRHDVEWNIKRTLAITDIELTHGIRSSLYFRVDTKVNNQALMRRLQDAGFEIGYHFNTLDRCRGDFACARRMFEEELKALRDGGLDIVTAIPHGDSRVRRIGYSSNADLFERDPALLVRTGLLDIAAGLTERFPGHVYIADLGVRWNGVRNLADLRQGMRVHRWPVLSMLTHPDYWSASPLRALALQAIARTVRTLNINRVIAAFRALNQPGPDPGQGRGKKPGDCAATPL